jgi:predicted glycosyltransferase
MRVLEQKEMTAKRMAEEIETLIEFRPRMADLNIDGARRSAEILLDLVNRRRGTRVIHAVEELVKCPV